MSQTLYALQRYIIIIIIIISLFNTQIHFAEFCKYSKKN